MPDNYRFNPADTIRNEGAIWQQLQQTAKRSRVTRWNRFVLWFKSL